MKEKNSIPLTLKSASNLLNIGVSGICPAIGPFLSKSAKYNKVLRSLIPITRIKYFPQSLTEACLFHQSVKLFFTDNFRIVLFAVFSNYIH